MQWLVVDDGSSDGTRPLVERYATADPRIRLLRHPDHGTHGMSASRNRGQTFPSRHDLS